EKSLSIYRHSSDQKLGNVPGIRKSGLTGFLTKTCIRLNRQGSGRSQYMMKVVVVFAVIIAAFADHAKTLELKKSTRSIFIEEKENWTLGKDLFGMPFIYFSPQQNGQRSNISFTDTGAELELDIKALAKSQSDYQKDKKEWAEEVGALPLAFRPYDVSVNQHGHKIHQIGFSYSHEGDVYFETSYYI